MKTKQVIKAGLIGVAALGLVLAIFHNGFAFSKAPEAAVHVGKTESRCSSSSSCVKSAGEFATFDAQHVLLIIEDNHALTRRIASLLVQQLTNSPYIDRIDSLEPSQRPIDGGKAPGAFLRLGLLSIKEEGIATRTMNATVSASFGDRPWQSSSVTRDPSSPPTVGFSWNSTVDNEVRFSGFQTDKYADAAASIADSFAKSISNELRTLSADYPRPPQLPLGLYGPYTAVEEFAFLKEIKARRVCSYSDLFTHNQTFWTFETTTNPVPQLQRLIEQIESSKWTVSYTQVTNTTDYRAAFRRGDGAELEVLRAQQPSMATLSQPENSMKFVVRYRMPFSLREREAALEQLFGYENAKKLLFPFQYQLTKAQRDRFQTLLETATGDSPQDYLQLARTYADRHQTNSALEMLVCAKALAESRANSSSLVDKIESEWKKLSGTTRAQLEITPEVCRKLKFVELTTNAPQSFQAQRDFGSPLVFFSEGDNGVQNYTGVTLYSFTISKAKNNSFPWFEVVSREGSRSTIASTFNIQDKGQWKHPITHGGKTYEIEATAVDETGLRYEVRVKP